MFSRLALGLGLCTDVMCGVWQTAGVQAPAGKQGPFRVIYSVSGENPKVFRYYGVVSY